jgi:hypothetical protein
MKNCFLIIALSNYIGDYLINKFSELNIKVSVRVFKHPVDIENIILFDLPKYLENPNKKLLQIGQQMRKLTSIMRIKPIDNYKKMWLTGTIYFNYCYGLLHKEITTYKIDTTTLDTNVELVRLSVEEYDDILSKNIVFIDLFDASANNTVLECIIRNTPIIINKLPAVIEYLGEDYPLYFNDLEEVEKILKNDSLIKSAHEYLIKMYKEYNEKHDAIVSLYYSPKAINPKEGEVVPHGKIVRDVQIYQSTYVNDREVFNKVLGTGFDFFKPKNGFTTYGNLCRCGFFVQRRC